MINCWSIIKNRDLDALFWMLRQSILLFQLFLREDEVIKHSSKARSQSTRLMMSHVYEQSRAWMYYLLYPKIYMARMGTEFFWTYPTPRRMVNVSLNFVRKTINIVIFVSMPWQFAIRDARRVFYLFYGLTFKWRVDVC